MCTELLLSKNVMRRRIHSRAAIAAFAKTTTKSAPVREFMQVLEKLSVSNKVTLVWIPRCHRTLGNEESDKLAKEWTNGVPSDQTVGILFVVVSKSSGVIWDRSTWTGGKPVMVVANQDPNEWTSIKNRRASSKSLKWLWGCLQATALTAYMFKLRLTKQKDCWWRGQKRRWCMYCVSFALACKRYGTLGHMFLMPKDLENMMVNGLISLVAITRLGLLP